ncbi:MAG: type II/IV secretion system protein [Gammaproteobacteria bacterium]|nr:type II/IV secretion system protein [Gammaproteobacteria bacterium]
MTHPFHHRSLIEILKMHGNPAVDTLSGHDGSDAGIARELLRHNLATPEQIAEALAEQAHVPYVALDNFTVPPDLFGYLPAERAYEHGVLPYRREGNVLSVVVADPTDLTLSAKLERLCGLRVDLLVGSARAIAAALKRSEGTEQVLKGLSQDFRLVIIKESEEGKEHVVALDELDDDTDSPVVKLINTVLLAAIQKRASDVHIEAYEKGLILKYRIDGVLYPATDILDRRHHSALVSRLKVMAELDIAEKRTPQDGRFRLRFGGRDIDFRISVLPGAFGEDVVIRILDKTSVADDMRNLRLENLGISGEILKRFRKCVHEPYGMVLITGPTGSGKTTTLYAALTELNMGEEKIITIEDPVEYQFDGIVQIAVNEKKGLTFARGLRSILRHDPDKIMVGEIRDTETAQIAVQSALTGHLVFTTVHANNSIDVIGRFTHMGIDLYSFVSALNCVMAQRLVRMICQDCRHRVDCNEELLENSGIDPHAYAHHAWYEGAGCAQCHGTGYRGRKAITELLVLTPSIRQMIIDHRPAEELLHTAINEGMLTLRQAAIAEVLAGVTTLKEINRVTFVE